MAKKKNFEQSLRRLEEIIDEIERNDVPLEQSVALYKEAIDLVTFCGQSLRKAEEEITLLKQTADGLFMEEKFD